VPYLTALTPREPSHIIEPTVHTCRVLRLSSETNGQRAKDNGQWATRQHPRRLLGPCHLHHSLLIIPWQTLIINICIGASTLTWPSNSRIEACMGPHRAADTRAHQTKPRPPLTPPFCLLASQIHCVLARRTTPVLKEIIIIIIRIIAVWISEPTNKLHCPPTLL